MFTNSWQQTDTTSCYTSGWRAPNTFIRLSDRKLIIRWLNGQSNGLPDNGLQTFTALHWNLYHDRVKCYMHATKLPAKIQLYWYHYNGASYARSIYGGSNEIPRYLTDIVRMAKLKCQCSGHIGRRSVCLRVRKFEWRPRIENQRVNEKLGFSRCFGVMS